VVMKVSKKLLTATKSETKYPVALILRVKFELSSFIHIIMLV
jgi:hypothetical protein